jgi:hypothetical protein
LIPSARENVGRVACANRAMRIAGIVQFRDGAVMHEARANGIAQHDS